MLIPILRYGKCGFDQKMDKDGFIPILPLIELKRFKEFNVTKDCIVALSIREKGSARPRFESNATRTAIRATSRKNTWYPNDITPNIAPSVPKSNQPSSSHQTHTSKIIQTHETTHHPPSPKTPSPKIPRYGPNTPIKTDNSNMQSPILQDTSSKDVYTLNNTPKSPSPEPTGEDWNHSNPSANDINMAIMFFNEQHPQIQNIRQFREPTFNLIEDAFQAGCRVGRKIND